ncbi:MAG: polyribonucleotide nucleotidyltransferase [Kiritimatiellae bacterium]|nr:polyribonucleotide nucleotidyltransferase [Kiritimatiellia bacterium]MDW8457716.1 polyribonucleotide nucleotidyltransferase [Verrucomicrobiota bacterium]
MSAKQIAVELGGKTITFEAGLLAQQANGAVTARIGDTIVFSAVTATKTPREGVDFFPLQVEYREKYYAAGKFPGGYFKRESKPSEREIITARVTDRPLRPFFPDGYRNDVQINNMLLSADGENESDILSILAASAALVISDIPFFGPIGAVRVGRINGRFVYNPTHSEMQHSDLNLVYAGSRDLPVMIEGNANEISEADMVAAMRFAHEAMIPLCDAQLKLRELLGLPPKHVEDAPPNVELLQLAREIAAADLREALRIVGKQERAERINAIKAHLAEELVRRRPQTTKEEIFQITDALEIDVTRRLVLEDKVRIGGRAFDEIRPLYAQVGVLPRVHGSALFSRGETQALATVTLGTSEDAQELDAIAGGPDEKNFILHYNFPPYSVGEVGKIGATGRREIGHGNLAERSLYPVVPKDFPYSIRVVSEIMGSNGSSSMATVCVGTLALMDAGIPIRKPVAGISIGLFTGEDGRAELVTDIIGAEDHCGDMDFKVSGTRDGITGFQVDLKIRGLPWPCVQKAFEMARVARLKILDYMQTVIANPRPDLSPHAPRIKVIKINPEKIGALIGPGGKNIRRITDTTGTQIDIEDDGTVKIFATSKSAMDAAEREVNLIAAEAEVGKIYQGTVTGIKEFGAFVEILPGIEGLVHISEMADRRIRNVEEICKVGDLMWVKCIEVQENGKVRLSRKQALAELDKRENA